LPYIPITVSGKAWVHRASGLNYNLDSSWVEWMEVSPILNPDNIIVLKNGDPVPNKPGYLQQIPVSTYLAPYTKNGKIVLGPYDAIFLFELGGTDTASSAFDLNDLIVLVTVKPAS
ncbi:MAG TPA: hypothetical protein VN278_00405, partial [Methanosarcina sp.]|nr:hypothetical protein [Methanosarcina sp.]